MAACPTPMKYAHTSQKTANKHLLSLWLDCESLEERLDLHAYECRCGAWHIGHASKYGGQE